MKRLLMVFCICSLFLSACNKQASSKLLEAGVYISSGQSSVPDQQTQTQEDAAPSNEEDTPVSYADGTSHGALDLRPSGDVVYIPDKLFVAQTNDIYYNYEDYMDKTIQYEGFYDIFEDPFEEDVAYHYVARYGPGCCAIDAIVGFEIFYDGEMPNPQDWVEVSGKVEILEEEFILVLKVDSLIVLDTRGVDTVFQ